MVTIAAVEMESWERPIFKRNMAPHKVLFVDGLLTPKSASQIKSADILVTFIHSRIDKAILSKLPKLSYIATMSTGYDHIDLAYCKKHKIKVSNVPFYGENTVAEHTMGLILAIARKLPQSIERTRKGDFSLDNLRGFDLKGKTLGVVGGGHIGLHVVRMARGFEMEVLVSDPHEDKTLAKRLGFTYANLNTLLKASDIITLHVPLNKYTEHMINKDNLKKVKKGAMLINTSRGGVVDTEALLYALDNGTISFAGLDVLEGEFEIKEERQLISSHFKTTCDLKTILQDHILLKHKNVFITPHNAFNSEEAVRRILDTTIDNVKSFIAKKPMNVV
ncbi:MAG TPA: hydroxyacid dehydrogenase [Candidatus Nanoarchaeia archaeon]|nr:hydroxyacid dehydrogenase [Candidatus Nanoarchaeia archaeon]